MYRVYAWMNENWVEMGNSPEFSAAWQYGKVLVNMGKSEKVKVVGPEGSWDVK